MKNHAASLGVESLALILEYVDDTSPQTTEALRLVNKHWNFTSHLVAHRRKTLTFDSKQVVGRTAKSWMADAAVTSGLRHLTVSDHPVLGDLWEVTTSPEQGLDAICDLIKRLGNLQVLRWNTTLCITIPILEALGNHHPKAKLQISNWHSKLEMVNGNPTEVSKCLSGFPQLVSINCKIVREWGAGRNQDDREATFRRIVATAPGLKHATLHVINSSDGAPALRPEESPWHGSCYPEYYTHQYPNSSVRTLTLDGYSLSKPTLLDWGRFVDLSGLENFKCTRGFPDTTYFLAAPVMLTSLKHVSLNLAYNRRPDFPSAVQEFFKTVNALESLSLWSWHQVVDLDTILDRHGPTLKVLQLHERESMVSAVTRRTLKLADIRLIRTSCPNLEDLTFDLDRQSATLESMYEVDNIEIYNEVAQFGSRLQNLQIYFDLGLKSIIAETYSDPRFFLGDTDESDMEDDMEDDIDGSSDPSAPDGGSNAGPNPSSNPIATSTVVQGSETRTRRRKKQTLLPPSEHDDIESYVSLIWSTVFGSRTANTGPMQLIVKFGEWERKFGGAYGAAEWLDEEQKQKTLWHARAAERDDREDLVSGLECLVEGKTSEGLAW